MSDLVLSLFPGVGLLDRAFEEEGFCVVRGPDLLWGGDVHRFHPPARRFDGVIGGPPCQLFSGLGNLSRARGTVHHNLIPEFERVVFDAKPEWFLMENVSAAPVPAVDGYTVIERLVNNRHVGGEQSRVRRFSFGARGACTFHIESVALEAIDWKPTVTSAHGGHRRTHSSRVTGGKIHRYLPDDAAEAQGLPRDFLADAPFTAAGRLKAIANGVPLPLGRAIARAIKRAPGLTRTA